VVALIVEPSCPIAVAVAPLEKEEPVMVIATEEDVSAIAVGEIEEIVGEGAISCQPSTVYCSKFPWSVLYLKSPTKAFALSAVVPTGTRTASCPSMCRFWSSAFVVLTFVNAILFSYYN
jgi:hypothetical protein